MTDDSQSEAQIEVTYSGYSHAADMAVTITIIGTAQEVRNAERAYFAPPPAPAPDPTN